MLIATPIGFFSVVQKPFEPNGVLTVRARAKEDLENLRDNYLGHNMSQITTDERADYHHRATTTTEAWGVALTSMARHIDYSNFKNAVKAEQGSERAGIYGRVWSELYQIQKPSPSTLVQDETFDPTKGEEIQDETFDFFHEDDVEDQDDETYGPMSKG